MNQANVWKIDGTPVGATPQTIVGRLLATVPDLEYRSFEAMKDLFCGILDLSIEMALIEKKTVKGAAQGALTRHITATKKQMKYIPQTRERLLTTLFDKILQCEGLGSLVGFTFSNKFGDTIKGNAERESIMVPINIYQKEKEKIMTAKKTDIKIKRSALIAAAKEMNRILAPDPEIEVNMPVNELTVVLLEAKTLLATTDKVDPAVRKTLNRLSISALVPPVEAGKTKLVATEKVEAPAKEKTKFVVVGKEKKRGVTTRICELVCENFEISEIQVCKLLEKEGFTSPATATVKMQMGDTLKAINCLKNLKKLK